MTAQQHIEAALKDQPERAESLGFPRLGDWHGGADADGNHTITCPSAGVVFVFTPAGRLLGICIQQTENEAVYLAQALLNADAVARQRGDQFGLCDCVNNAGMPYPSEHLSNLLKFAREHYGIEAEEVGPIAPAGRLPGMHIQSDAEETAALTEAMGADGASDDAGVILRAARLIQRQRAEIMRLRALSRGRKI